MTSRDLKSDAAPEPRPPIVSERGAAARAIARLRRVGAAEGISFLVLLGVAMPLKYLAGMPMAVKVVGWAHGVLFVVLVVALLKAKKEARWPIRFAGLIFVAALLPFGPFVIDRRLAREEKT
jgi:integral membrane protein